MERRKFMIGAGSTAIGASALVGSGAFSSVEADRTVGVETADDNDAYLALYGDNEYVTNDGNNGTLTIDLGGAVTSNGGQGFNDEAITEVDAVNIKNQGTNRVDISVDDSDLQNGVSAWVDGVSLNPGKSANRVITFRVDTKNASPDNYNGTLVIHATE